MSALFNLDSEVNTINLAFAEKLGLVVQSTNIGAQKIDGTIFEIYRMVVAAFSVIDQANKVKFFKKTFLVVNISPDIVVKILFLSLSNANVDFPKKEL